MTLPQESDPALDALVERVCRRDPAAEAELHRRLKPFLLRRVEQAKARRNWFWLTDVESMVQDVFTQFFQALADGKFTYEGRRRLEGFLLRTAFFVAMNERDRAVRDRALSLHDDEDGGLRFDVAAFAEAVYDQLDRRACLELLARTIGELNQNRREIVERTLLGQKVRQICAETGRTPASVSGLKFNALVELRRRLDAVGFTTRCGELFGVGGDPGGTGESGSGGGGGPA